MVGIGIIKLSKLFHINKEFFSKKIVELQW